jgi:hypothetical protein
MGDTAQNATVLGVSADAFSSRIKEGIAKESQRDDKLDADDRKFLGIIPANSPTVRGLLQGVWSGVAEASSGFTQRFFFKKFRDLGAPHIHDYNRLKFASSAAATAVTLGIATLPYFGDMFGSFRKFNKEKKAISKKLKPLLEEIKGNGSFDNFMSIRKEDNEVLYAHRRRMQSDFQANLSDDTVKLVFSNAPNAVTSLWRSGNLEHVPMNASGIQASSLLPFVSGVAPQIAEAINEDSKKAHQKKRQPYSALEMIMHLDDQVRDVSFKDGKGTDSFSLPGKGDSKPMAEYIAEIFRQHQRDMEGIDGEYSQLRSALDPQLLEISESIAQAIKRGDLAVMSIARLAGEGYVVKNKGRALNKPSEVKAVIEKMSGHALNYLQVDAKEYFAESSFSKRDLKEALQILDGDEKLMFASMIPDSALRESGMDDAKIKSTREATQKLYEQKLSQIVMGLSAQPDAALKNLGLAEEEIKQLRTVADHVKRDGEKAIHEYRANPANTVGIERVVTNAVVNKVQGDKQYLGQIISQGTVAMQAPSVATPEKTDTEEPKTPLKRDDISAADDEMKATPNHKPASKAAKETDEDKETTLERAEDDASDEKSADSKEKPSRDHASRVTSRREAASHDEGLAVPA